MRKYITRLSEEDFSKVCTSCHLDQAKSSFPQVVALISIQYPSITQERIPYIHIKSVKHIYSTRDYWEVLVEGATKRHKIPKRYTDAIYLIEED
jgi:hypothetical protein